MFRRKPAPVQPPPPPAFPKTLAELGFRLLDEDKPLRKITGERFKFRVKHDDKEYNERHMIAVAETVGEEVERHLQEHYGCAKVNVPLGVPDDEPHSYVFYSKDYTSNADKLLVLVSERNNRVGQWDRRYLFDVSVQNGAMFGYIQQAFSEGYAVLVTNTNTNYWRKGRSLKYIDIPGNEDGVAHLRTVFRDIIPLSPAKIINIVAVGYGALCVIDMLGEFTGVFRERVAFINALESHHSADSLPTAGCKHTINWVVSNKQRATEVKDERFGCCCLAIEQRKLVFQSFNGQLQVVDDEEDAEGRDEAEELFTVFDADNVVYAGGDAPPGTMDASTFVDVATPTATISVIDDVQGEAELPATAPAEAGEKPE
ncbi:hypothetical protein SYNPS1DRAFT_23074 [Syncephalis pseudoplumigaleata]|uniref:Arb2 domain-containing protein n=1 Tax=Syncephalis pseudoplumigaleata TaxID=1712513 RepID=A0A4P9YZN6_9FUNG|nr:hypothetical protein SYNPS1DRAFT_23074 [Syncephalis pseudoplumigaleata]|eukprot:RKP24881.1 hypothetical protein SYNPS1DRAFT_23074 [Syncephalis pseudoplumigaleata]